MSTNLLTFVVRGLAVSATALGLAACEKQAPTPAQPSAAAVTADARVAVQRVFSFAAQADRGANQGRTFAGELIATLRPAGGNVPGAQSLTGYWVVNGRRFNVGGTLSPAGTGTTNQGGFGELTFQVKNFAAEPFSGRAVQVDADVQPDGTYLGRFAVLAPTTPRSGGSGPITFTPVP